MELYKKVGDKFILARVEDVIKTVPLGAQLIVRTDSQTSRRAPINPDFAAVLAVFLLCQDRMTEEIMKVRSIKPDPKLTDRQLQAWKAFQDTLDTPTTQTGYYNSAANCVQQLAEIVAEVANDFEKDNPQAQQALENFRLFLQLVKLPAEEAND